MNNQEQLNRIKSMMTYGLNESKKNDFSSLEYHRLGCDGKMYGIVKEGTSYFIKVSENTKDLIKENFKYIGGFRNRKENQYSSYANALKHFDINMRSLNEAHATKGQKLIVESWNPEKQEFVMVEATKKMRNEIARQRQIMNNASMIFEGKDGCCDGQCPNGKQESAKKGEYTKGTGDAMKAKGVGFEEDAPKKPEDMPNLYDQAETNIKEGKDNGTLAWHKTGGSAQENISDTYMDMSNGTEIGSTAPFDKCPKSQTKTETKNGTVEEGTSMAMDCGDNQNNPTPGVSEIGDDAPFNKKTKKGLSEAEEGEEPIDDEPMSGEEPMDDTPMGGEDFDSEEPTEDFDIDDEEPMDDIDLDGDDDIDPELEGDDDELELEPSEDSSEISSLKSEIDSLKDLVASIASKLGVSSSEIADSEFADDTLYDDDDDDDSLSGDGEEEMEFEIEPDSEVDDDLGFDDEEDDFEGDDTEDFEDEDDTEEEVFESRSFRRMKKLNEDKLNYFGKHPAWRKKVMTLPQNGPDKTNFGADWNDSSAQSEAPYAEKIGSSAPFEENPEQAENAITKAIAESVKKVLGRRNRR